MHSNAGWTTVIIGYNLILYSAKIQQIIHIAIQNDKKNFFSALYSQKKQKEGRINLPSEPLTELRGTYTF